MLQVQLQVHSNITKKNGQTGVKKLYTNKKRIMKCKKTAQKDVEGEIQYPKFSPNVTFSKSLKR